MTTQRIFWFVVIAVLAIALGSFALSFLALKELAISNGVPAGLGFIWPLIVDVSVVVFTAAILVSQLQKRGAKLAITLTIFYAIVTITGNVLHAPATWLGWFVAILPPISLIFATEMLRAMAHHNILQHTAVTTLQGLYAQVDTKQQELETLNAQAVDIQCKLDALKSEQSMLTFTENNAKVNTLVDTLNDARYEAKQERLNTLVNYLADNPQATLTDAAQVVNVSRQTVGKYVNQLTQEGVLQKNGNGWEVAR